MASTKRADFNKAALIRQALTQHPGKAPSEIARMLTQQHGVPFSPKKVSSIKSELRTKKAPARKAAAPASKAAAPAAARKTAASRPPAPAPARAAAGGVAEMVTNLQAYVRRLGKEDLHRLINTL